MQKEQDRAARLGFLDKVQDELLGGKKFEPVPGAGPNPNRRQEMLTEGVGYTAPGSTFEQLQTELLKYKPPEPPKEEKEDELNWEEIELALAGPVAEAVLKAAMKTVNQPPRSCPSRP
ncbi:MAG: hypothetical protein QM757_21465 [Paludibaculum sp.]